MREGIAAFDLVFNDERYRDDDVAARGVGPRRRRHGHPHGVDAVPRRVWQRAQEALDAARDLGDPALIAPAWPHAARWQYYSPDVSRTYLDEAIDLARASGNRSKLCDILSYLAVATNVAGLPIASQLAAEEGRDVADAVGDGSCRDIAGSGSVWRWRCGATP